MEQDSSVALVYDNLHESSVSQLCSTKNDSPEF
jgi:hypothetical protein